jgi:AmiR/NasT family two-component response regulator
VTDGNSARVNLAQGIVSVQAGCGMDEALVRMHVRAEAIGLTMEDLAEDIVDHLIWFTAQPG